MNLMSERADLSALKKIPCCSYSDILRPVQTYGGYRFVHGPSIQPFDGALYCAFGYNEGAENSVSEQLMVMVSRDDGATWSVPTRLCENEPGRARSHGVLFVKNGRLYCAAPSFEGLGDPLYTKSGDRLIRFLGLKMEMFLLEGSKWVHVGRDVADFWPLGAPEETAAGELVMPGCDGNWLAALAQCAAGDFPAFDRRALPLLGEAYSEAGFLTSGSTACVVMRNQTKPKDGKLYAAICQSQDGGRTYQPAFESTLPMNASKPCCGKLPDGRFYLVFNYDAVQPLTRRRLLLGVTKAQQWTFEDFYLLEDDEREKWLCYPDARVEGDTLYIVYSAQSKGAQANGEPRLNHNDIRLVRIKLSAI